MNEDFHKTKPVPGFSQAAQAQNDSERVLDVSVIIPHWNGGDLLRRAVVSVPRHRVVEVIVSDDGSTQSLDVLDDLEHAGVRVLRHDRQTGEGGARNRGLAAARGAYVLFLDADDQVIPDGLAALVSALERNPEVDFAIGSWRIEGTNVVLKPPAWSPWRLQYMNRWPACFVCRRATVEALGGFPAVRAYADWALWARVANAQRGVAIIDAELFCYRVTSGSLLSRSGNRFRESYQAIRDSCPDFFDHPPSAPNLRTQIVGRMTLVAYGLPFALALVSKARRRAWGIPS